MTNTLKDLKVRKPFPQNLIKGIASKKILDKNGTQFVEIGIRELQIEIGAVHKDIPVKTTKDYFSD